MFECIDKDKVRGFFDQLAPEWDERLVVYPDKMERILDAAGIRPGCDVLDIACGTGVMVGYYLGRGARRVTAVDFSGRMASICQAKHAGDARVEVLCADAESCAFPQSYDAVMVFNAFPHFPDPQVLIAHAGAYVKPGGTFTVAHDLGRKKLDDHHSGVASAVSHGMMHEDDVAALFGPQFDVRTKVSEPDIFIVSATRVQAAANMRREPALAARGC